jgi:hypothetical protein
MHLGRQRCEADFNAWNVDGHRPTKIAAHFLPLINNATEAAILPTVRM